MIIEKKKATSYIYYGLCMFFTVSGISSSSFCDCNKKDSERDFIVCFNELVFRKEESSFIGSVTSLKKKIHVWRSPKRL